jgi:hypothetical protein
MDKDFASFIGKRLRVQAGENTTFEADVFAVDAESDVVLFRRQHAHTWQKADYDIVHRSAITSVEVRPGPRRAGVTRILALLLSLGVRPQHLPPSLISPPSQVLQDGDTVHELNDLQPADLERRYNDAAHRDATRIARKGKGVSPTDQKLFDYLAPK